jgi:hypothetical protein
MTGEIFIVVASKTKTNTMMLVQDGGNSIKSKAIHVVFLQEPS